MALAQRAAAQNAGMAFVSLKPWEERNSDETSAEAVIHSAKSNSATRDGFVNLTQYASRFELGTATDSTFVH
ncbi:hypothetical protein ACNKHL_19910 [Shigella flexneri]